MAILYTQEYYPKYLILSLSDFLLHLIYEQVSSVHFQSTFKVINSILNVFIISKIKPVFKRKLSTKILVF